MNNIVKCQCIKIDGNQCLRDATIKPNQNFFYCWQHQDCKKISRVKEKKKIKTFQDEEKQRIQLCKIKMPMIDLYEFKIENYSDNLNPFKTGFKVNQSDCGRILTDNKLNQINDHLSSCDLIETDPENDWESILGEDFKIGYQNEDLTPLRLIKDIYYECKIIPSKTSVSELNKFSEWSQFCKKWRPNIIKTIKLLENQSLSYFNQLELDSQIIKSNSYIRLIEVTVHEKIIIMGDFHGSVHTFLRHLFRFHRLGILDLKTLKMNPNYRLVFLGDVIDRGSFSLEICAVVFKLMEINNLDYPIVIYNRGNHEELTTSNNYGFHKEILQRCSMNNDLFIIINEFYKSLSSAVILEIKQANKIQYRYWLCHGGFDSSLLDPNSNLSLALMKNEKPIVPFTDKKQQMNVRWSDFIDSESKLVLFNNKRGVGSIYNKYHVYEFFKIHNINFIIRGHQDSYNNNYLFSPWHQLHKGNDIIVNNLPGFGLNYSVAKGVVVIGQKGEVVRYNEDFSQGYVDRLKGPLARILANGQNYLLSSGVDNLLHYHASAMQLKNNSIGESLQIFPVLTISTNTDYGRPLRADSFIVLRFDKDLNDPVSGYLVENSQMQPIDNLIGSSLNQ